MAHQLSCSAACGILLDQGPNPSLLHWQADSYLLLHQGSPLGTFLSILIINSFLDAVSIFQGLLFLLGCLHLASWDCLGALETLDVGSTEKLIRRSKCVSGRGFVF